MELKIILLAYGPCLSTIQNNFCVTGAYASFWTGCRFVHTFFFFLMVNEDGDNCWLFWSGSLLNKMNRTVHCGILFCLPVFASCSNAEQTGACSLRNIPLKPGSQRQRKRTSERERERERGFEWPVSCQGHIKAQGEQRERYVTWDLKTQTERKATDRLDFYPSIIVSLSQKHSQKMPCNTSSPVFCRSSNANIHSNQHQCINRHNIRQQHTYITQMQDQGAALSDITSWWQQCCIWNRKGFVFIVNTVYHRGQQNPPTPVPRL